MHLVVKIYSSYLYLAGQQLNKNLYKIKNIFENILDLR